MTEDTLSVLKVGGSLLEWPELPRRLTELLDGELGAGGRTVLVVGGGAAADVVRAMDRAHVLGEERSHRLALRAMDLTAALLAECLPRCRVVTRVDEIRPTWDAAQVPIFAPRRYLEEVDAIGPDPLPASWDVTSDSIAARLARDVGAGRLVLLKSTSAWYASTLEEAARAGLVDRYFPVAAAPLARVEIACLRDVPPTSRWLQTGLPAAGSELDGR